MALVVKAEGGSAGKGPAEPRTVAELAAAKALPVGFLREQGLGDVPGGGISIAYYDADGRELFTRARGGKRRFDQPAGVPLAPYGRWRLADHSAPVLWLTEGETDALTLWYHGMPALGVPGSNAAKCLTLEDVAHAQTIYVLPDNDKAGTSFAVGVAARLVELAWPGRLYRVLLPSGVKDANELHVSAPSCFLRQMEPLTSEAKQMATAAHAKGSKWAPSSANGTCEGNGKHDEWRQRDRPEPRGWVMEDLLAAELPEPRWLIPGLLSEGLNVLAGKPKQGKSFLALNLALTVAAGGMALGDVKVQPARVLYLSLEDKDRRVQARARKILSGLKIDLGRRLEVYTAWPRMGEGGLEKLAEWAERHREDGGLIVIDVLKKFKAPARGKGNAYDEDYEVLSPIKEMADKNGVDVLAIHHVKKARSEDWIEDLSGSMGVGGTVDGAMLLVRNRGEDEAILKVTGRDAEEKEIAVRFHRDTCVWESLGEAGKHTESKLGNEILALFKLQAKVMFWPREVADTLKRDRNQVCSVLSRMVSRGQVYRQGGRYGWPPDPPGEAEGEVF